MPNLIMVIYIQNEFHEIILIGYLVMTEDEKIIEFRQLKDNNSAITNGTQIRLRGHNLTLIIYIQYKFYEIPSIGYLVIVEDR